MLLHRVAQRKHKVSQRGFWWDKRHEFSEIGTFLLPPIKKPSCLNKMAKIFL
jgi:hypothetical protein